MQRFLVSFRNLLQRLSAAFQHDATTGTALLLVLLCVLSVSLAALYPSGSRNADDLGKWLPIIPAEQASRAILVDYDPADGSLCLKKDDNEFNDLLTTTRQRRFANAHIRKFNRHVRGRTFRTVGKVKGPRDCLFTVTIGKNKHGEHIASLVARDLSIYNLYPVGKQTLKNLGPIHFAPTTVKQPFFSDGSLGFLLDPTTTTTSTQISLAEEGVYNLGSVVLTDEAGHPRALIRAAKDGSAVEVEPVANYAVFLENNPSTEGTVRVEEGQIIEIGGHFFEAHMEEAATIAQTRQKAGSIKRIYPLGGLLHIVGPVALDGAHQPLGIEYMFQEYLMGAPSEGLPPGELWLTLDERLQAQLTTATQELSVQSRRGVASVLIMNAQSGALLAMAASPRGYDPENRAAVLDILSRGKEPYYNHGCFKRHVIGSVNKAFYAFLGLQAMGSEITNIVVDTNVPATKTLYGHRLYGDNKAMTIKRAQPSFVDYLIQSDNGYQHSLGMLLLAGVTQPEQELPGRWHYRDKQDRLHLKPILRPGEPHLEVLGLGSRRDVLSIDPAGAFSSNLEAIFGISTASGSGQSNDREIRIYGQKFLEVAAQVMQARNPATENPMNVFKARSVVCAPESARMELREVRNTKDVCNVLYGANRNRWTDVKACEAFSRIMTGTRVQARLVNSYRDPISGEIVDLETAAASPPPLDVPNPEAFAIMRRYLERVPKKAGSGYPAGTAQELDSMVTNMAAKFPGFKLIGKTGTIDDGLRGAPNSRLFLGCFGLTDETGFKGPTFSFIVYLKNAQNPTAHFNFINEQLPLWWEMLTLQPPPELDSGA